MMQIQDHDSVNPTGVLELNMLSLGYALTPERVAQIRQLDPRPFPFFAVYAVIDGIVAGQVGVFRLPMVSIQGPEDVGGAWAVCTHPAFTRQGIASRLLEEAHKRMRSAGLRFSTLGTARHWAAYTLYRQHGYENLTRSASIFTLRKDIPLATNLKAERAGNERLHLADGLFHQIAKDRLGFARRYKSFFSMLVAAGDLNPEEVWLLREGKEYSGYALAKSMDNILSIKNLLLVPGIHPAQAVAAIVQETSPSYIRIRLYDHKILESLQKVGYPPVRTDWGTFMVKPLADSTLDDARRIFGVGTEAFLISPIDVT